MNFNLRTAHRHSNGLKTTLADKTGLQESRIVSALSRLVTTQNGSFRGNHSQRSAFVEALHLTFSKAAEGVMSPFLFYDPPKRNSTLEYKSPWGTEEEIPYGGEAWDLHVSESVSSTNDRHYSFTDGDVEALRYAIEKRVVETRLPKNISFYSYCPGELIAVQHKDCVLIQAYLASPDCQISTFTAIDILDRYASAAAVQVHNTFNVDSYGIEGDVMEGRLNLEEPQGTPLVAIFGGPFANAPSFENGKNSKQKAAEYFSRINERHGLGAQLIMTVDLFHDEEELLNEYEPTKTFEAFILSAFPRAVQEGIIKNPDYDVFEHWRMRTFVDTKNQTVKLCAECKKDHDLVIEDEIYSLKKGDLRTFTLSNKWDQRTLKKILTAAGFGNIEFFGPPGSNKKIVIATAKKAPNLSLVA